MVGGDLQYRSAGSGGVVGRAEGAGGSGDRGDGGGEREYWVFDADADAFAALGTRGGGAAHDSDFEGCLEEMYHHQ